MKTAMIKPNYHLPVLLLAVMAFLLCAWPVSGKTALGSSNVSEIGVLESTVSKSLTALGKSIAYRSRALGNSNVPVGNTGNLGNQNADLISDLRRDNPDLSNAQIANLASPNLTIPDVPIGFTRESFSSAQDTIQGALDGLNVKITNSFATGSRVTGITTNPKKPAFGSTKDDFTGSDLDITLVTDRSIDPADLSKIKTDFFNQTGIKLGIRNIDESQAAHIPVFGKIDLDLN